MSFSAGDIVVCIDNAGRESWLTLGDTYKVTKASDNWTVVVTDGVSMEFRAGRFKPADKAIHAVPS